MYVHKPHFQGLNFVWLEISHDGYPRFEIIRKIYSFLELTCLGAFCDCHFNFYTYHDLFQNLNLNSGQMVKVNKSLNFQMHQPT